MCFNKQTIAKNNTTCSRWSDKLVVVHWDGRTGDLLYIYFLEWNTYVQEEMITNSTEMEVFLRELGSL